MVVKTNAADMQTKGNTTVISFFISSVVLTVLTWFCFALNVAYTPVVRSRALTDDGTGVRLG
jgi:hypothetical protein